jgi:C4-dicarboxylate-specific signal transduction histidine kinase
MVPGLQSAPPVSERSTSEQPSVIVGPPPLVALRPPLIAAATQTTASERRHRRVRQEFAVRATVCALVLLFNEAVAADLMMTAIIRLTALIGLLLNLPYHLAVRSGVRLRAQAYARMLIDVGLMTAGLYGAGGLGAAQYIGIYAIVPVYTAFVFSTRACVVATGFATVGYLLVVTAQALLGCLPFTRPPTPDAWLVAAFNLLVLNIVGCLAGLLAEAYRVSRQRLAVLYRELERAHDEALKLNTELQDAARRSVLGDVVAGVTHEVRNALQGAFGHLWLARRTGQPLSPEAASHLDQAEYACENAMRIIRSTLDMARQPAPERERVSLADVVRRVSELKAVELRRDGISLERDVPDTLPAVLASPYQLQQVLLNLIANAQDELRESGGRRTIVITGRAAVGQVALEVRDTGPGIAPNVLPHVFEPFYTTKAEGSGLGLPISAGIVESFGGTLTAENRREGGGAVFRVMLPTTVSSA